MKKSTDLTDYVLEVDTFGPKIYRETFKARNDKEVQGVILRTIVDVFEISHLGHVKEVRLWKKIDSKLKVRIAGDAE